MAYNLRVLLDSMSEGQLVFDPVLHNDSHPITQQMSDLTSHGLDEAMLGSTLGPRYHSATITKFSDTKDVPMPFSVKDMVCRKDAIILVMKTM